MTPTQAHIRLSVDNARRLHRVAVWFANQARLYGWSEYAVSADKLNKDAWDHLADARRIKAGESMGEAA